MGSGMPEIGSRISLISKADIRYEGKLYAVDPDECTIALSSVRSYGTEDRETKCPVPAQSQVYDFILFRGSDIKDIRVLTATIPNDPAIVQLSVPPSIYETQFQSQPSYSPPSIASMMPNVPSTSRQQPPQPPFQSAFPTTVSSSAAIPNNAAAAAQAIISNLSEDDSRSSTPSTQNAAAAGVKNNASEDKSAAGKDEDGRTQQQRRPNAYGNRGAGIGIDKTGNRFQKFQNKQYNSGPQQQQQQHQQQSSQQQPLQQQQQQQRYQQNRYSQNQNQKYQSSQQQTQYRDYNRENYRNYNDYRDPYARQYAQPMRNTQRNDGGWSYGGGGGVQQQQRRGLNRLGQQGGQQNNYQGGGGGYNRQQQQLQGQQPPKNTLKFEGDFDFEQANSKFEEVKVQLGKLKIEETAAVTADGNGTGTATATAVKVNGDVDAKKEDSGNEVSGGEENDAEGEDKPIFYDKVKSFFDTISYEAIERSKGHTQRMDWKTERKINSETFGSVALRRNNNFRGGAGGGAGGRNFGNNYYNYQNRNQGMGNNYRSGGGGGGYRPQGNQNRRPYQANKSQDSATKAN